MGAACCGASGDVRNNVPEASRERNIVQKKPKVGATNADSMGPAVNNNKAPVRAPDTVEAKESEDAEEAVSAVVTEALASARKADEAIFAALRSQNGQEGVTWAEVDALFTKAGIDVSHEVKASARPSDAAVYSSAGELSQVLTCVLPMHTLEFCVQRVASEVGTVRVSVLRALCADARVVDAAWLPAADVDQVCGDELVVQAAVAILKLKAAIKEHL
jgi:hypothetical protein